jgi:hypothetical protein
MSYKYTKGSVNRGDLKAESAIDSDGNTYVDFGDDSVGLVAGGVDFIKATEAAQDILVINEAGADVDFRVESSGEDEAIFLNAGNDTLHINKGSSAFSTIIYGNSGNAMEVNSSGVTINEGGVAANDFRVESNNKTHMVFVDAGNDTVGINTNAPSSTFHVVGSQTGNYTAVTGNTTLDGTHYIVNYTGNGDATLTLPAVSGLAGRIYHILCNTQGENDTLTIDGNGSETFAGANLEGTPANVQIEGWTPQSITVVCTGARWQVLIDSRSQGEEGG